MRQSSAVARNSDFALDETARVGEDQFSHEPDRWFFPTLGLHGARPQRRAFVFLDLLSTNLLILPVEHSRRFALPCQFRRGDATATTPRPPALSQAPVGW